MEEKLIVTAKYGNSVFSSEATPFYPEAHKEQYDSCVSEIEKQMKAEGKYEMRSSFSFFEKVE